MSEPAMNTSDSASLERFCMRNTYSMTGPAGS